MIKSTRQKVVDSHQSDIELPEHLSDRECSNDRLIEMNESRERVDPQSVIGEKPNPFERNRSHLSTVDKLAASCIYFTTINNIVVFKQEGHLFLLAAMVASVLSCGLLLSRWARRSESQPRTFDSATLMTTVALTAACVLHGTTTNPLTVFASIVSTISLALVIKPIFSKSLQRWAAWTGILALLAAAFCIGTSLHASKPVIGILATSGFDQASFTQLLVATVSSSGFVTLLLTTKGRAVKSFLIAGLLISLAIQARQYRAVSRNIEQVQKQLSRDESTFRLISSINASYLDKECGQKYTLNEKNKMAGRWEGSQDTSAWLNANCRQAATDFYSNQLLRCVACFSIFFMIASCFLVTHSISDGQGSITRLRGKVFIFGATCLIALVTFILTASSLDNIVNPVLAQFAVDQTSGSPTRLVVQKHENLFIKGSLNLDECRDISAMVISNMGSDEEVFYRVAPDCTFGFQQSATHSKIGVMVNKLQRTIDISSMLLNTPVSGVLRLESIPVLTDPAAALTSVVIAENIISGNQISSFSVNLQTAAGQAVQQVADAKTGSAAINVAADYYSITITAEGFLPAKISTFDLYEKKTIKAYLIPSTFASQAIYSANSSSDHSSLMARIKYEERNCYLTEWSPICPGVQLFKRDSDEETLVILAIRPLEKIEELSFEQVPIQKHGKSHRRVLEDGDSVNKFVDDGPKPSSLEMRLSAERATLTKSDIANVNNKIRAYLLPADVVGATVTSLADFAPYVASLHPASVGELSALAYDDHPVALDEEGITPFIRKDQTIKAIKFNGDNGAVWFAVKYEEAKFIFITNPQGEKPSSVWSPGDINVQILTAEDTVYPTLKDSWLSVNFKDGKFYNFGIEFEKLLFDAEAVKVDVLPKVDTQSNHILNLNQNAYGSVIGDAILEIIEGAETTQIFERLDKEGKEYKGRVATSKKGYVIANFKTHITKDSTSPYRVCVYCVFYSVRRKEKLNQFFKLIISKEQKTITFELIPDSLQIAFNNLYHFMTSVVFIDSEHNKVNSIFFELEPTKYFELGRDEIKSLFESEAAGKLANNWFNRVEILELRNPRRTVPLVLVNDKLFQVNKKTINDFISGEYKSFEPAAARGNVGNRIDVLNPYFSGINTDPVYLNQLFEKYSRYGNLLFIRDCKNIPYNIRTYPHILRSEDRVLVKYFLNAIEVRALFDKGPAPFSGVTNPGSSIVANELKTKNQLAFVWTELPKETLYLAALNPKFSKSKFTSKCVQDLYDLKYPGLFTTFENRVMNKLKKDEREVWVDNNFRVLNTEIVALKRSTGKYENDREKTVIESCYPDFEQKEDYLMTIGIIFIKDKTWIKGYCSMEIVDNKCEGLFTSVNTDGIVTCEGDPRSKKADFDACKKVAGKFFGTCKGRTDGAGCSGEYFQNNIAFGADTYNLYGSAINYDYNLLKGYSTYTWNNPKRNAAEAEINMYIVCDESVVPEDINTCKKAHYVYLDDQDDIGEPGLQYRQDVICGPDASFVFENKQCKGKLFTKKECHGRVDFEVIPKVYTCLGNYTQLSCANGGANKTCYTTDAADRKESSCLNNYFSDPICASDRRPTNDNIRFNQDTENPYTFITDSLGKIHQVANFKVSKFSIGASYASELQIKNTVTRKLVLKSGSLDPSENLIDITIPKGHTSVNFDEGVLNKLVFKNFVLKGLDYRQLDVDDPKDLTKSRFVLLNIEEVVINDVFIKSLDSDNGVFQEVSISSFNGEDQQKTLENFGYQNIKSKLAFGKVFLRNAEILLPYISKSKIDEWEKSDKQIISPNIEVPDTTLSKDLKDYKISFEDKKTSLEFPQFTLQKQDLDLIFVQDWVLDNNRINQNKDIVKASLYQYEFDQRLKYLAPELTAPKPIALTEDEQKIAKLEKLRLKKLD